MLKYYTYYLVQKYYTIQDILIKNIHPFIYIHLSQLKCKHKEAHIIKLRGRGKTMKKKILDGQTKKEYKIDAKTGAIVEQETDSVNDR